MNLEIWVFSTHPGGQARTGLLDTFGNLLRSLRSVGTHAELTHAAIWLMLRHRYQPHNSWVAILFWDIILGVCWVKRAPTGIRLLKANCRNMFSVRSL